jgi:uncharacterized protein (TIGR04255 family)
MELPAGYLRRYFTMLFTIRYGGSTIPSPEDLWQTLRVGAEDVMTDFDPFRGPPPAEVPLSRAPLIRVLAQVKFPLVASIERRDFIAPFQEGIRKAYPILRPEKSQTVLLGPEGVQVQSGTTWRFENADKTWRVSLAPDFLALETTRYTSRDDFLARLETVLVTLGDRIEPAIVDRVGMRYIDRIKGEHFEALPDLVRPEIAGIVGAGVSAVIHQSMTENLFGLPDGQGHVLARWGLLPPQATFDPGMIEPLGESSWILDLDAFVEDSIPFDTGVLLGMARGFAERIYSVFRWVVTDEFLRRYGGGA